MEYFYLKECDLEGDSQTVRRWFQEGRIHQHTLMAAGDRQYHGQFRPLREWTQEFPEFVNVSLLHRLQSIPSQIWASVRGTSSVPLVLVQQTVAAKKEEIPASNVPVQLDSRKIPQPGTEDGAKDFAAQLRKSLDKL